MDQAVFTFYRIELPRFKELVSRTFEMCESMDDFKMPVMTVLRDLPMYVERTRS
jgi:hypothetical protein